MDIELLYFDDYPSWKTALANIREALVVEKLDARIHLIKVQNVDQAQSLRFLGSPTIRINGSDLWPGERDNYFFGCRVYPTPEGLRGWPTVQMIREKLSVMVTDTMRGV